MCDWSVLGGRERLAVFVVVFVFLLLLLPGVLRTLA